MEREVWRREIRRLARERYDKLHAPMYHEYWGATISPTHERFFNRFLDLCPPQAYILDAACGTGKYWPMIVASGRAVFGIDQSQGMLSCAHAKFPEVPLETVGLQEMRYREAFDGASCMDAMECVFPEDWPLVLGNLQQAIRPCGYLYFTVEIADEQDIRRDFMASQHLGLPVVYGESVHEGGGYHYYPEMEQVGEWLQLAGFRSIDETVGDEYHHFLVQKP